MRLNESSKHSFYNSLKENLNEGTYYYKRWGKNGAGEIDYREFNDMWDAQNFAEKVNKETGDETAVYKMSNDECIAVFDEKKDNINESYDDDRKYRINYDDDLIVIRKNGEVIDKGLVDSLKDNWNRFEDFHFDSNKKKYVCEYNGDTYTIEKIIVESSLKEDEDYVIDDEELKKYAAKYQASDKRSKEMFKGNCDPYSQPQEIIDIINKGIAGCSSWEELMNDYNDNPESDWYIDIIRAAQRELARRDIDKKEKEEKQKDVDEEKEYKSAKRELEKLRKEHSTRVGRIEYLFNLVKDYESKHGIEESSLTEDYKPVQDMWEGPGTYYIAAKQVTGTSLESSYDISDKEQFKKFLSDHPEYVENNCKGYRANLHTHGTSSYRGKYWKNDLTEDDEVKHKVPDYAKECIEEGIYDSRGINVRSALFQGNTLVVESRDELTEEVFDKIVKIIESYFRSYGVVADSIEDDGNKVLAIDCFMTEEGYQEYLANADSDDEKLVINGQEFNDVSDAKAWLDEKIKEYGNTYFFPNEEKSILNKLINEFGNTYFWH